jgi:hypothetical protein
MNVAGIWYKTIVRALSMQDCAAPHNSNVCYGADILHGEWERIACFTREGHVRRNRARGQATLTPSKVSADNPAGDTLEVVGLSMAAQHLGELAQVRLLQAKFATKGSV